MNPSAVISSAPLAAPLAALLAALLAACSADGPDRGEPLEDPPDAGGSHVHGDEEGPGPAADGGSMGGMDGGMMGGMDGGMRGGMDGGMMGGMDGGMMGGMDDGGSMPDAGMGGHADAGASPRVGDPCTTAASCPAGGSGSASCTTAWLGGYCTVEGCSTHGHDCPDDPGQDASATSGSKCVNAPTARCLALCASGADCRPGYACVTKADAAGHGSAKVCFPQ